MQSIRPRAVLPAIVVALLLFCVVIMYGGFGLVPHDATRDITLRPEDTQKPINTDLVPPSVLRGARLTGPFLGTGLVNRTEAALPRETLERKLNTMFTKSQDYKCSKIERFGKAGDGGYDVCMDPPFTLKRDDCLVYSFGIRDDWTFDEAAHNHGCEVHSFDPSINLSDHLHKPPSLYFHNLGIWGSNTVNGAGWKLQDLETIMKELGHEGRVLDYLKMDVEGAEWPFMTHFLQSGIHARVKQIVLEIHTPRLKVDKVNMDSLDLAEVLCAYTELEQRGFRKFSHHNTNGCCGRFVTFVGSPVIKRALCCYETVYVNTNYIS